MKRLLAALVIFFLLSGLSFGISILIYPDWLNQSSGPVTLIRTILVVGLGMVLEGIVSWFIAFLFEDKEFKERLIFSVGNKYKRISYRLDDYTRQEIDKEKNSKKYIPNIFVEATDVKEKLRYFSEPIFFFRKIIEQTDRELRGAYIVSALKQVHYPLNEIAYPKISLQSENHKSFKVNVQSYAAYLGQKQTLTDVLIKEGGAGIKPELKSRIPSNFSHIHEYMYPNLQFYSSYEWAINDAKADLDLLLSKVVITKSIAGHGKTNLICDFTENFLLRKGHKCLYISARSLNHLGDQETIEQAIIRTLFTESDFQFSDILRLTKYDRNIDFLFILIDGINEHKNLPLFSAALEQFIQRCSEYKIKIILTCRSEYFDDRFGNLLHIRNCSVIDMDAWKYNNHIPDVHIESLLSRYFSEFKVELTVDNVDPDIMEDFNEDKLLLRIFCEAYENEQPAIYLDDLYKLEIFRKYYEKKIATISGLENCLGVIISIMLAENQFSNVHLSRLPEWAVKVVENTVYENVIIKKDVIVNPDLAFGKTEVINFVYDEFRDFLIASTVINEWDRNNQSGIEKIQNLASPSKPIAEGLQRYLCLWSIKNKKVDLLDYLSSLDWFDTIFINSVFNTPDKLLSDFVFELIRGIFNKNSSNTVRIVWRFIRRANVDAYPNLNISLLFDCLNALDDNEYQRIVVEAFSERYDYETTHVTHLCLLIVQAFKEHRVLEGSVKNLIKLLAYLIGIADYSYLRVRQSELGRYPASQALDIIIEEFGDDFVKEALAEVISNSHAESVKSSLSSYLRLMGEE